MAANPRQQVEGDFHGAFADSESYTEVDRAVDNLVKSGKMFGMSGGRRESSPYPGPARRNPGFGKVYLGLAGPTRKSSNH